MKPETAPVVTTVGSNCTGTTSTLFGSVLLALSRAEKITSLPPLCTPIFLPTMSCGVLIGSLSVDRMQNGFFWYVVPTIFSGAPLLIAGAVIVGADSPTKALPVARADSAEVPEAPPATRSTFEKPAAV